MELVLWIAVGAYATLGITATVLCLCFGQRLGEALLFGLLWPFMLGRR